MSGKKARARRKNADPNGHTIFFSDDGREICTRAENLIATEQAAADDRKWFEAHPHAKARIRPFIRHEIPIHEDDCQHVLVRQIKPGHRMRQPLMDGWQPFTFLRIDPESGEVLGKYSDAEAWEDILYNDIAKLLQDME